MIASFGSRKLHHVSGFAGMRTVSGCPVAPRRTTRLRALRVPAAHPSSRWNRTPLPVPSPSPGLLEAAHASRIAGIDVEFVADQAALSGRLEMRSGTFLVPMNRGVTRMLFSPGHSPACDSAGAGRVQAARPPGLARAEPPQIEDGVTAPTTAEGTSHAAAGPPRTGRANSPLVHRVSRIGLDLVPRSVSFAGAGSAVFRVRQFARHPVRGAGAPAGTTGLSGRSRWSSPRTCPRRDCRPGP